MLELYDDREQTFTCGVTIEGSQYSKAIPRLVVSSRGKNIFFEGKLKGNECHIIIPPMSDIEDKGKVSLELVIDNALMTPWNSTYKVISSFQTDTIDPKIYGKELVESKREQARKKEFKITKNLIVESKKRPNPKNLKENVSKRNKMLVNDLLIIYNTLSIKDKDLVFEAAKSYRPKKKTYEWAKKTFNKPTSIAARICMYEIEQYLQKQEKSKQNSSYQKVKKSVKQMKSQDYKEKKKKETDVSKPDRRVMSQRIQKDESTSAYRKLMKKNTDAVIDIIQEQKKRKSKKKYKEMSTYRKLMMMK